MVTINGDRATVTEKVSGLADKLPTDKKTLAALGIPAAFAGKPFPHVQHVHIMGRGQCPTSSADANGDGVISTVEGHDAYGMIGTTFSTKGSTGADTATDVTVAPGGGSYSYKRTFPMKQDTLDAITDDNGVVVVHGLNPATAPALRALRRMDGYSARIRSGRMRGLAAMTVRAATTTEAPRETPASVRVCGQGMACASFPNAR
jgi:hypothetical protein